jgi:hypothetical protein
MHSTSSPLKHGPPAGASGAQSKEDFMEFGGVSSSPQRIGGASQLTQENLNKLPITAQASASLLRPMDSISNANTSLARTQIMASINRKIDPAKARNYCTKHKLVYVNKCL